MNSCQIYTMPLCPYCMKAKKFLERYQIPFVEKTVVNPVNFKEMRLLTQSLRVPITHYKEDVLTGFKQDEFEKTFGEFIK